MGWKEMLRDSAVSLGHGIADVTEAGVGLGAMMPPPVGPVVRWMANRSGYDPEAAHRDLDRYYTPQTRQAMDAVENARGAGSTIAALYENPRALAYGAVRQAPGAAGGMGIGRLAVKPALEYVGKKAATAAARRKATQQAGRIVLDKATPYAPGIGTDIAANAIGEGIVGTGQGAEEIRQEAPTAPWTAAKSGQAITRGFGEGVMSAATGFGLRGLPGRAFARQTAAETMEFPGSKVGENVNRERAFRDYVSTTDMMM